MIIVRDELKYVMVGVIIFKHVIALMCKCAATD